MDRFLKSKKENRTIKLAIVGCGNVSQKHLKAIIHHRKNFELKAICDNNSEKIDLIKKRLLLNLGYKKESIKLIKFLNSYQDLINLVKKDKTFIDIVILCTPSGLHVKEAILAAEADIHVITEKPMALKLKDGIKMVKKFRDNNLFLFVVKQIRFNNALKQLKNQIDQGRFGTISLVTINVLWNRPQKYYDSDLWRGTKSMDGGALINQASHYVDLLVWLFGNVESVFAQKSTLGRDIEVEDTCLLQFKLKNGTLGNMAITMLTYERNFEGSITVIGENGTVKIGGTALDKVDFWKFADQNPLDNDINKIKDKDPVQGHIPYYQSIIDFFEGSSKEIVDGNEGLKSLELIEASYLSAERKELVKLPLYEK